MGIGGDRVEIKERQLLESLLVEDYLIVCMPQTLMMIIPLEEMCYLRTASKTTAAQFVEHVRAQIRWDISTADICLYQRSDHENAK